MCVVAYSGPRTQAAQVIFCSRNRSRALKRGRPGWAPYHIVLEAAYLFVVCCLTLESDWLGILTVSPRVCRALLTT